MYTHFIKKWLLIGFILYVIPLSLSFLLFRFVSWIIHPEYSIENAIYAYAIFVGLIVFSIITGLIAAKIGVERKSWVKFSFAVLSTLLSSPVVVLAIIVILYILFQNWFVKKFISKKAQQLIQNSAFGCTLTSILSAMLMFSNLLFVVEVGNVRTARDVNKATMAITHLGSGDYFIAATLGLFKNWRVMIGANLWKYPLLNFFFDIVGVPIPREDGAHKQRVEAINISKEFLYRNQKAVLGVFPQGTRERSPHNGIKNLRIGAFVVACELGVPLIPIVIVGTNKWRKPGEQDTKSHNKKGKKNIIKGAINFAKQYYTTGINPTIVKVVYCNPISPIGKTPDELKEETERVMNETYIRHTTPRRLRRKMRQQNGA